MYGHAPGRAPGPSAAALRQERDLDAMDKEAQEISDAVKSEFQRQSMNGEVARALHAGPGAVTRVSGGKESTAPHELQLVMAWRPTPHGEWQLGQAVVHRVHHHDSTVTVQFLPDQHRCRLPWSSVKPLTDCDPAYPAIRLAPGERLPTRAEIMRREHNASVMRQMQGLGPDDPLPGDEDALPPLRPGEFLNEDHKPYVLSETWGIPAPTLDALRNRSVPGSELTGTYGQHFYSNLYKNNFYPAATHAVSETGRVQQPQHHQQQPQQRVVSHRYVPLNGPELVQDLSTGEWMAADQPDSDW